MEECNEINKGMGNKRDNKENAERAQASRNSKAARVMCQEINFYALLFSVLILGVVRVFPPGAFSREEVSQ